MQPYTLNISAAYDNMELILYIRGELWGLLTLIQALLTLSFLQPCLDQREAAQKVLGDIVMVNSEWTFLVH